MGYQALLFCPDEKTARTVTQVLSELDFTVTPCTEPFAAVKRLMAEHFDAVVVDCDNDQNATLLFKSARNTSNNQAALAVAVVEGQAGVAKAFRIGANLVLTKPINVDQAKGTLRVARGLLRKSEASKPAPAATAGTSVNSRPATEGTIPKSSAATAIPAATPIVPLAAAAGATASIPSRNADSAGLVEATPLEVGSVPSAKTEVKTSATKFPSASGDEVKREPNSGVGYAAFGSGAASAPAPARETPVPTGSKVSAVITEPETRGQFAAAGSRSSIRDGGEASVTLPRSESSVEAGGGGKKALLAVAAIAVIAVVGMEVWLQWGGSKPAANVPPHLAVKPAATSVATVPTSAFSPSDSVVSSKTEKAKASGNTATRAAAVHAPAHQNQSAASADSAKPVTSNLAASKAPTTKTTERPIVIKNDVSGRNGGAEAPVVSMNGLIAAAGNGGVLPTLVGDSKTPAPMLQRLNISQGVSRGLLVKQVQPTYPASALRMRVAGAVQLLATISKSGNIAEVEVISGNAQLAQAAADAVKQWKYKPYLLSGEPVEIQTQITVNFKLPR